MVDAEKNVRRLCRRLMLLKNAYALYYDDSERFCIFFGFHITRFQLTMTPFTDGSPPLHSYRCGKAFFVDFPNQIFADARENTKYVVLENNDSWQKARRRV